MVLSPDGTSAFLIKEVPKRLTVYLESDLWFTEEALCHHKFMQ